MPGACFPALRRLPGRDSHPLGMCSPLRRDSPFSLPLASRLQDAPSRDHRHPGGPLLICRSRVLKAGAQLTVAESEVSRVASGEERLVSKTTVTLAVISPRAT